MQVAPAVPNFGFSMPESVRRDDDFRKVKDSQPLEKKQKHNLLGLTPRSVEHEESGEEEEVVDEEASGMNTGIGFVVACVSSSTSLKLTCIACNSNIMVKLLC